MWGFQVQCQKVSKYEKKYSKNVVSTYLLTVSKYVIQYISPPWYLFKVAKYDKTAQNRHFLPYLSIYPAYR